MNTDDTVSYTGQTPKADSLLVYQDENVSWVGVYTNNQFTGHYPAGSAAVVFAYSQQEAADLLNAELRTRGLEGDAKPEDMRPMTTDDAPVRVLCDGDY